MCHELLTPHRRCPHLTRVWQTYHPELFLFPRHVQHPGRALVSPTSVAPMPARPPPPPPPPQPHLNPTNIPHNPINWPCPLGYSYTVTAPADVTTSRSGLCAMCEDRRQRLQRSFTEEDVAPLEQKAEAEWEREMEVARREVGMLQRRGREGEGEEESSETKDRGKGKGKQRDEAAATIMTMTARARERRQRQRQWRDVRQDAAKERAKREIARGDRIAVEVKRLPTVSEDREWNVSGEEDDDTVTRIDDDGGGVEDDSTAMIKIFMSPDRE